MFISFWQLFAVLVVERRVEALYRLLIKERVGGKILLPLIRFLLPSPTRSALHSLCLAPLQCSPCTPLPEPPRTNTMDGSTPLPPTPAALGHQKRPRVAEENRKRAVRA